LLEMSEREPQHHFTPREKQAPQASRMIHLEA